MKNIATLIVLVIATIYSLNAQTICATAVTITHGTHTVTEVVGGGPLTLECTENFGTFISGTRWFVFTASVDGLANITSNLAINNGGDTRLHVYTGTCNTLMCLAGNDDIDRPGNNFLSDVSFPVTNGVSYYIAWDNKWSSDGFDFILSETAVTCPDGTLPLTEDFESTDVFFACYSFEDVDSNGTAFKQRFIDLDGDNIDNVYVTNGSVSTNAKDDWIFSPPISLTTGNQYTFNFKYNGANGNFPADENLELLLMDSPSATANELSSLFYESGIVLTGDLSQAESMATSQSIQYTSTATGTYYLAFNATSDANTGSLLLFDYSVEAQSLSLNENNLNTIVNTYNKHTDILSLKSTTLPFNNIEIFNILGQRVLSNNLSSIDENINLSFLKDGIYLGRVTIGNRMSSFKVLKQ